MLFKNFKMIDVIDRELRDNLYLEVTDGRISKIDSIQNLKEDDREEAFDFEGKYLMPGLFNLHIHALATPVARPVELNVEDQSKFGIRGSLHLQQYLKSGVTFVRDMNGRKLAETGLKESVVEGIIPGPEYFICGQALVMTGGHGSNTGRECDGVDECRKAAREQLKRGADFIKLIATGGVMSPGMNEHSVQLNEDEMRAAIEEAHKVGKKTAAHAHGAEGIKNAIRAGIDSIEHGSYLDDEGIEMMLERGTALVPTLSVDYFVSKYGDNVPQYAKEKAKRAKKAQKEAVVKAFKAGVMVGVGTDAGTPFNPHFATYQELISLVELGFTEMEALVAATINSAKIAGVEADHGSIETGKLANFVILENNPLESVEHLKEVHSVYKNGEEVKIGNVEYLPHLA